MKDQSSTSIALSFLIVSLFQDVIVEARRKTKKNINKTTRISIYVHEEISIIMFLCVN